MGEERGLEGNLTSKWNREGEAIGAERKGSVRGKRREEARGERASRGVERDIEE